MSTTAISTEGQSMPNPAYAVAYLRDVRFGPDVAEYMRKIDATLEPYDGRFLVHGGHLTPVEGEWPGTVIMIEFPSRAHAQEWYDSPAYQEILPLRTNNSDGMAAILDGVKPGHRATDRLTELLAAAAPAAAAPAGAADRG